MNFEDWEPIATAPRDGTFIRVGDADLGEWYVMCWNVDGTNPLVQRHKGIWETYNVSGDNGHTWSEGDGFGPTLWQHCPINELPPANVVSFEEFKHKRGQLHINAYGETTTSRKSTQDGVTVYDSYEDYCRD